MFLIKKSKWNMVLFLITILNIHLIHTTNSTQDYNTPCFTETIDEYVNRLRVMKDDFARACKVESKPEIQVLLGYSSNLANLEAYKSKSFSDVPNKYTLNQNFEGQLNQDLSTNTKNLIYNWSKGGDFTSSADILRGMLNKAIESFVVTNNYPVFFLSNSLKLSEFIRQLQMLSLLKTNNNCVPATWNYVTTRDYFSGVVDQVAIKYNPKQSFTNCPNNNSTEFKFNNFKMNGGDVFSFWILTDMTQVTDNSVANNILYGTLRETNYLSYDLIREKNTNGLAHVIKFYDQTKRIDISQCVQWAFVMFTVQAECDHYKFLFSLRFAGSNRKLKFNQEVRAANIEGMTFNFNFNNQFSTLKYPRLEKNFVYSFDNEMVLMKLDKVDNLKECPVPVSPNPNPYCIYRNVNGDCIFCQNDYYLDPNKQCVKICPEKHYGFKGICYPCFTRCKNCLNELATKCLNCIGEFIWDPNADGNGGECKNYCPEFKFVFTKPDGSKVCQFCSDNSLCRRCKSKEKCDECIGKAFMYNDKCWKRCPNRTYTEGYKCIDCPTGCNECTSKDNCNSCINNYYIYKNQCYNPCPNGTFLNSATLNCENCLNNCQKCVNKERCIDCMDKFTKKQLPLYDLCFNNCNKGNYMDDNGFCLPCRSDCASCTSQQDCVCKPEIPNLKDSKCVGPCGDGYYLDSENKICRKCMDYHCKSCSKQENCEVCENDYLLYNNKFCFYKVCPRGTVQIDNKCVDCGSDCAYCLKDNLKYCIDCTNPSLFAHEGNCVSKCPEGYFGKNGKCYKCASGCKTCSDDNYPCECLDNYWKVAIKDGRCIERCEQRYYQSTDGNKICYPCRDKLCKSCSGSNMCDHCLEDYFLYNGACWANCPESTYPSFGPPKKCNDCNITHCSRCKDQKNCEICKNRKLLYQGQCVYPCPDGTYEFEGKCLNCTNIRCRKCEKNDPSKCIDCTDITFIYLLNYQCEENCPNSYYPDIKKKKCIKCISPCKDCISNTSCINCIDNFNFNSLTKTCNDCEPKKYKYNDQCLNCPQKNCLQCNKDYCITCDAGWYLYSGVCYNPCPPYSKAIDNRCVECPMYFLTCGPKPKCIANYYYNEKKNTCDKECERGYYPDPNDICKPCNNKNCDFCDRNNSNLCIKPCPKGFYLNKDDCVICPEGFWSDYQSGECKRCKSEFCAECTNYGKACPRCLNNYFLYKDDCVKACPDGSIPFPSPICVNCSVENCKRCKEGNPQICIECKDDLFLIKERNECLKCTEKGEYQIMTSPKICGHCGNNCDTCSDETNCIYCSIGYKKYMGRCYNPCPKKTFEKNGSCYDCSDKNCLDCWNNSYNYRICNRCESPFYVENGQCKSNCSDGFYPDSNRICKPCVFPCKTCTDLKTCKECESPSTWNSQQKECYIPPVCNAGEIMIDGKCNKCQSDLNCDKCNAKDLTRCINCQKNLFLILEKICVEKCWERYYPVVVNQFRRCEKCIDNCLECPDNQCKRCDYKFYYNPSTNTCDFDYCKIGTYKFNGICKSCGNCEECLNADYCIRCPKGYYKQENKCVTICDKGYYPKDPYICIKCVDCPECKSEFKCTKCTNNKYLEEGKCVPKCSSGYCLNNNTSQCNKIQVDDCETCYNSDPYTCDKCRDKIYRSFDRKICGDCTKPRSQFKLNDFTCGKCFERCLYCDNISTCITCVDGFYVSRDKTKCVTECEIGERVVNGVCTPCNDRNCAVCQTNIEDCVYCKEEFYIDNKKCVNPCGLKKYVENKICKDCSVGCSKCLNKEYCTDCDKNYYLFNGQCIPNPCPEPCICNNPNCLYCNKPGICGKCNAGFYKLNNIDGHFRNYKDSDCVTCNDDYMYRKGDTCQRCQNCKSCKDETGECNLNCDNNYVLQDKVCRPKCYDGFVSVSGECKPCTNNSKCLLCLSTDLTACVKCQKGYKLFGKECVEECKEGFYPKKYSDDITICTECSKNCQVCNDYSICKKCQDPYTLTYPNTCELKECLENQRIISSPRSCIPCWDPNCINCSETEKWCKKCRDGYVLTEGRCSSNNCLDGYWLKNNECVSCSEPNCLKCPKDKCERCVNGFYLNENGRCVSPCPDNAPANKKNCQPCEEKDCKDCNNNARECSECIFPKLLLLAKCVPDCPKGYASKNQKCVKCKAPCLECTDPDYCDDCPKPFLLSSSKTCYIPKCDYGNMLVGEKCLPCNDKNCKICNSNLSTCIGCLDGFVLRNDGTCQKDCGTGYYFNLYTVKCEPCDSKCLTCRNSQKQCPECIRPNKWLDNTCVEECPIGYFQTDDYKCKKCNVSYCNKCDGSLEKCIVCSDGFYKNLDKCVYPCPSNKRPDITNTECIICKDNCSNCNVWNGQCLQCDIGFFLYKGDCVNKCPDKTRLIGVECVDCKNRKCKTCLSDTNLCESCENNWFIYIRDCYANCPEKTYPENKECKNCSPNCLKCTSNLKCIICDSNFQTITIDNQTFCQPYRPTPPGPQPKPPCNNSDCAKCPQNLDLCTECKPDKYLYQNNCVKPCPMGTYLTDDNKFCKECKENCQSCDNNQCVCKDKFYMDDNGNCVYCDQPLNVIVAPYCKTCKVDKCLKCKEGKTDVCEVCNYPWVLVDNQCRNDCPSGFYMSNIRTCITCKSPCIECTSDKICTKCDRERAVLEDNECKKNCKNNKPANSLGKCFNCKVKYCDICKPETPEICNGCVENYYLNENECNRSCPIGTYNFSGICKKCSKYCKKCISDTVCILCDDGNILEMGICKPGTNCSVGFYYDKIKGSCVKCEDGNCWDCSGKYTCRKCIKPYLLNPLRDNCDMKCPDGYYENRNVEPNICMKCTKPCRTCKDSLTCWTCDDGYYLYNNTCEKPCPETLTPVKGNCTPCKQNICKKCNDEEVDNCIICNKNYYLYNQICYEKCKQSTYPKLINNNYVCIDCDFKCLDCDENGCIQCRPGYTQVGKECINPCPDGRSPAPGPEPCSRCSDPFCRTCQSNLITCIDCNSGYFVQNGECVRNCEKGYYLEGKECKRCMKDCLECENANECIRCSTNLFQKRCVPNCPVTYYTLCGKTMNTCEKCKNGCNICDNPDKCKICQDEFYMYKEVCYRSEELPLGRYIDNKFKVFKRCGVSFCDRCNNDPFICDTCSSGYILKSGLCNESKSLTNIFNSANLFNEYTLKNMDNLKSKSFNKDLSGNGILSSEIAFSFWMRLITPIPTYSQDSRIFRITVTNSDNSKTYDFSKAKSFLITFGFTITNSGNNSCYIEIKTPNANRQKINGPDCSFANLNDWRLFVLVFKKLDNQMGSMIIRYYDEKTSQFVNYSESISSDWNYYLVSRDSSILFNEDANINPTFELNNMNLMEYQPNENDLKNLLNTRPFECEGMCYLCSGKCKSCAAGSQQNANCPASFISLAKDLLKVGSVFTNSLRNFQITKRISSNSYSLVTMFYISQSTNVDSLQFINLAYNSSSQKINLIDFFLIKGNVSIVIGTITSPKIFDKVQLTTGVWYGLNLSITEKKLTLQIIEWGKDLIIDETLVFSDDVIRITEDVIVNIGTKQLENYYNQNYKPFIGSISDARLYAQGAIENAEFINYYKSFGCDKNCLSCKEDLTCKTCPSNTSYDSSSNKCLSNGAVVGIPIIDKISIYSLNSNKYDIPLSNSENYSISVWFRKKIHSLIPNNPTNNLISMIFNGQNKPILQEKLNANFVSNYIVNSPFDLVQKSFNINYQESAFQWFQLFFVKKDTNLSITVYDSNNSIVASLSSSYPIRDGTIQIELGSMFGQQINSEFTVNLYKSAISNFDKYRTQPKDCDPSCLTCNYSNGICTVCKSNGSSGVTCPQFETSLSRASIRTQADYLKATQFIGAYNPKYNIRISDQFKSDVNSDKYSVTGWFNLFKNYKDEPSANGKVILLFKLSNNDVRDSYYSQASPSRNLIRFELRIENNVSSYFFVISQPTLDLSIKVSDLVPTASQFLLIHAGIDVQNKKFDYSIFNTVNNKDYKNSVTLDKTPEKLQDSATLNLFGINSILPIGNNNIFANGYFYNLRLSVSQAYNQEVYEKSKIYETPINNTDKCDQNCLQCFLGECQECNSSSTLQNNSCVKVQTSTYKMLTDQTYLNYIVSDELGNLNSRFVYSVPVTSSVEQNHGFQVFIRRNFISTNYGINQIISTRKIITYGVLDIFLTYNSQDKAFIRIDTNSRDNTGYPIYLGPMDNDNNKDYSWYALLLFVDYQGKNLIAKLQASDVKSVETKSASYSPNSFTSVNFDTLRNEVSIIGAAQVFDVNSLESSKLDFPQVDCPIDCSSCMLNTCRICEYGRDENNKCNKKAMYPYNIIVSTNKRLTNFFSFDYLKYSKNPRFRDFSVTFSVSIDSKLNYSTIFRITNNADVSLLKYDSSSINYNYLSLVYDKDKRKYGVTYSSRLINSGDSNGPMTVWLEQLPSTLLSETNYIGLSVNHILKTISVYIWNRSNNFLAQTINFNGVLDNLGVQSNIIFGDDFLKLNKNNNDALFSVKDITIYYETSFNLDTLQRNIYNLVSKSQQKVCQTFHNQIGCTTCSDNNNMNNVAKGLCYPPQAKLSNYYSFFNEINTIKQSFTSRDFNPIILSSYQEPLSSFTFSLQYRRITYPKDNVIGIVYLGSYNVRITPLVQFVENSNSLIVVVKFRENMTFQGILTNFHDESFEMDWKNINLDCNLLNLTCNISVFNYRTSNTINKSFAHPAKDIQSVNYVQKQDETFALGFDFSSINLDGLNKQIGSVTEYEISNIIFLPNYVYNGINIDRYRPPVPAKCDRNCLCSCSNNICPDVCKPRDKVISMLESSVNSSRLETFRRIGPYFLNQIFSSGQKDNSVSLDYFIINAEINLKSFFTSNPQLNVNLSKSMRVEQSAGIGSISSNIQSAGIGSISSNIQSAGIGSISSNMISSSSSNGISSNIFNSPSATTMTNTKNSNILYILTNDLEAQYLKKNEPIPEMISNFPIITLRVIDKNTLRITMGSFKPFLISTKDIILKKSLNLITNLKVITYCDLRRNTAKITILADDGRFDVVFKYNYSSEPINKKTLLYTSPFVSAFDLIISPARLDYAVRNFQKSSSPSKTFCESNQCSECYSNGSLETCLRCNDSNFLFNNACIPKSFITSRKKKRTSTLNTNNKNKKN